MISKRILDVAVTALGIALLFPLLLGVAIWIKLDSPGPIFFRQVRVGRHGQLFVLLKFRTMNEGSESKGRLITVHGDPRITRAGRILRRFKIDEFPQLLNVFKGEMSLVGPRPEVPRYVSSYPDDIRTTVLSVRPGITDHASIYFRDEGKLLADSPDPEATYVDIILPVKLKMYVRYVSERTLWLDIKTILVTLRELVRQ